MGLSVDYLRLRRYSDLTHVGSRTHESTPRVRPPHTPTVTNRDPGPGRSAKRVYRHMPNSHFSRPDAQLMSSAMTSYRPVLHELVSNFLGIGCIPHGYVRGNV